MFSRRLGPWADGRGDISGDAPAAGRIDRRRCGGGGWGGGRRVGRGDRTGSDSQETGSNRTGPRGPDGDSPRAASERGLIEIGRSDKRLGPWGRGHDRVSILYTGAHCAAVHRTLVKHCSVRRPLSLHRPPRCIAYGCRSTGAANRPAASGWHVRFDRFFRVEGRIALRAIVRGHEQDATISN